MGPDVVAEFTWETGEWGRAGDALGDVFKLW
jgi:hypothetical protein